MYTYGSLPEVILITDVHTAGVCSCRQETDRSFAPVSLTLLYFRTKVLSKVRKYFRTSVLPYEAKVLSDLSESVRVLLG